MALKVITVRAVRDDEAGVWFVESSNLPGLNAEADTIDELVAILPAMVADLVAEACNGQDTDGDGGGEWDVPIELIAHASARIRTRATA